MTFSAHSGVSELAKAEEENLVTSTQLDNADRQTDLLNNKLSAWFKCPVRKAAQMHVFNLLTLEYFGIL